VSAQAGVSGTGSIIQSAWEAVVVSERFIRGAPDELISNIDHDPMLLQDAFRLVEHHHLGEQAQAEMAVLVIVPTKKIPDRKHGYLGRRRFPAHHPRTAWGKLGTDGASYWKDARMPTDDLAYATRRGSRGDTIWRLQT
jgi:hypothetical protein